MPRPGNTPKIEPHIERYLIEQSISQRLAELIDMLLVREFTTYYLACVDDPMLSLPASRLADTALIRSNQAERSTVRGLSTSGVLRAVALWPEEAIVVLMGFDHLEPAEFPLNRDQRHELVEAIRRAVRVVS
jgi:hypothetical protein